MLSRLSTTLKPRYSSTSAFSLTHRARKMSSPTSVPHVEPTTLGKSTVDKQTPLKEGKWIGVEELSWTDQDGKDRKWEMAVRKTTGSGGVDAVAIAALLSHPSKPLSIPIILQYRPPVKNICVELPAGLIDGDETAESTAVRELHEETGYGGSDFEGRVKVRHSTGVIVSDPGMSKANMKTVVLDVELKEGEGTPKPKLEEGEHIEVRVTPIAQLYEHLQAYEKLGYSVDARLSSLGLGIHLAQQLKL